MLIGGLDVFGGGAAVPARTPELPSSLPAAMSPCGLVHRPQNHSILVVEDEPSIASFVAMYLKRAGFAVRVADSGETAIDQAESETPSLIVLDLMLPDLDGIDVCRRLRQRSDVPILMLTARDDDVDKIIGLEVGADDYLTKPFNPGELVARVKSVLRRANPERRELENASIEYGALRIDSGSREVFVADEEVQLAPKEFDLLWELLDHRGLVLTRDQLLERVWGYTFAGDTRTVDVHVRQLRRKLGDGSPIVTVWGVGYKVPTEPKVARAS
jgi:DNA-binding response OmpR family regulator